MAGRWFEVSYHFNVLRLEERPSDLGRHQTAEQCPVAANCGAGRRLKPLWRFQARGPTGDGIRNYRG